MIETNNGNKFAFDAIKIGMLNQDALGGESGVTVLKLHARIACIGQTILYGEFGFS